ncbi:MAG: hypothetical protein J0L97_10005 [Alphaproteobacteria bacterium]|nr:hypothetical protein [Alphaproteobacteria bacterium]
MRVYNRFFIPSDPSAIDSFEHYLPPHERVIRKDKAVRQNAGRNHIDKVIYESFLLTHVPVQ